MMYRLIDANINRICEGLRVLEDFLRFEFKKQSKNILNYINSLKSIRHFLREKINSNNMIYSRDTIIDPGKKYSEVESNRISEMDFLKANFYRVEEGLRSLEESFKISCDLKKHLKKIKSFRFEIYNINKNIITLIIKNNPNLKNYSSIDIDSLKNKDIIKILNPILKNKITSLQLNGGSLNNREFYNKAIIINKLCNQQNINIFLKNNIEIALLIEGSNIVVDQYNLPINAIKKIYKGKIGYISNKLKNIDHLIKMNIDFLLLNKIPDEREKKILKNYSNKIKILVKKNNIIGKYIIEKTNLTQYSELF